MFTLFFTDKRVTDYDSARTCDTVMFGKYFNAMLRRGVYLAPSQFEALFLSHAINPDVCARILEASNESFDEVMS
jgi:glutamate-1-semialdehyde 2,1-aminomutase